MPTNEFGNPGPLEANVKAPAEIHPMRRFNRDMLTGNDMGFSSWAGNTFSQFEYHNGHEYRVTYHDCRPDEASHANLINCVATWERVP